MPDRRCRAVLKESTDGVDLTELGREFCQPFLYSYLLILLTSSDFSVEKMTTAMMLLMYVCV